MLEMRDAITEWLKHSEDLATYATLIFALFFIGMGYVAGSYGRPMIGVAGFMAVSSVDFILYHKVIKG